MQNEVYIADIEVRLRSNEAGYMLGLYRRERSSGQAAAISMLTADVMRAYGRHLVLLEEAEGEEFTILYSGEETPLPKGSETTGKKTTDIDSGKAEFFRLGCRESAATNDAVCVNHLDSVGSAVHRWECLFLPLEDNEHRRMFVALCVPRERKHDFLRSILDASPQGSLVATAVRDSHNEVIDAIIIYANRRAAELAEFNSADELIGSSLSRLFGDVATSGNWDRHLTTIRSNKAQVFDFHHRGESASRWFNVSSQPVKDGVLVHFSDVSDVRRQVLELEHQKKMLIDEMEQRRGLEQELWALAHLDPLTGLANRRAFRDAARLKLAESQTAHRPCAVISLDIDHFKRINDSFGHGAGDTVLRRLADLLRAPLRPNTDMAARMGGEEFSIILPDTDLDSASAFAEKLRKRVEQTVVVVGEFEIKPTISLGVAMNRKSADLDDLLERSDRALYSAKRTGRNRVCSEVDIQEGGKSETRAA